MTNQEVRGELTRRIQALPREQRPADHLVPLVHKLLLDGYTPYCPGDPHQTLMGWANEILRGPRY